MSELNSKGLREEKDKKWEKVQIKAFTLWVNSTLEPLGYAISDIDQDLRSGVHLCLFLEESTNKRLQRWNKTPALRVHKIENLNIALQYIQKDLNVKLVGIGPEDIADGSRKLTLGLLWSLFVKLRIDTISEGGDTALDGLLSWVRNMTEGYQHVNIKNFKESFNDGMAFAALVHAMNPEAIDFDSLSPSEVEKNLNHAFTMAEQKLAIPKLLEVEDIMSGNVDERAIILYNSLFFHAWNADEEKRRIKNEKESIADQLARLREENTQFQEENTALKKVVDNKDSRIAELEAEIEFLKKVNREGNDLRCALEEKIRILEGLLNDNNENQNSNNSNNSLNKQNDNDKNTDSDNKEDNSSNSNDNNGSGDLLSNLLESIEKGANDKDLQDKYLKELENRKLSLQQEMNKLKKQVEDEIKKRRELEAIIGELRNTIKTLQSKDIVNSQARIGLDALKSNLEEHLEDLYRWRELNIDEISEDIDIEDFNLTTVIDELQDKSFEEQLNTLDSKLQEENKTLGKIIKLQEDKDYLSDKILQAGWLTMKGRKTWCKRWFILSDNKLCFYEDEKCEKQHGSVDIDGDCGIVRQMAVVDEESGKKLWPLKLTVGDRKLFLRASSKKERHSWFCVLSSRISFVKYLSLCESSGDRPDTRLISVLKTSSIPSVYFANRNVNETFVSCFAKGILGYDELENISFINCSLTDDLFSIILTAISKLPQLKTLNFSKNNITNASSETFVGAISFRNLQDLDLSNNQLGDEFLSSFVQKMQGTSSLNSLQLDNNQFTCKSIKDLVDILLDDKTKIILTELSLSNNKLGDDGIHALLPLFQKFSFKNINLAGNGITDSGVIDLVNALQDNSVEKLNLSYNSITSKGAVILGNLMKNSTRLHCVSLSGNSGLILDSNSSSLFCVPEYNFKDLTLQKQ